MTKAILTVLASTPLLLLAQSAGAAVTGHHGSLCNPLPADVSKVGYGQFGVHNESAFTATVVCGASMPAGVVAAVVNVVAYDNNPSANVSCTLTVVDSNGGANFTQTKSTTGSGGGAQSLQFLPNANGSTAVLTCSIPPLSSGNASHVAAYAIHQ